MNGRMARERRRRSDVEDAVNYELGRPGRILDVDSEMALLGGLLFDPEAIGRVADLVAVADFGHEKHGHIFRAALELHRQRQPIDLVTLGAELDRLGLLVEVGGRAHLAGLQGQVSTAANIEHHAARVRRLGARRAFLAETHQLGRAASDPGVEVSALAAGARKAAETAERGIGKLRLPVHSPAELVANEPEEPPFIARGLVVLGAITELSAAIKAGKTTLILAMIAASLRGQTFLGQPTNRALWLMVTEEGPVTMSEALRRAGLDQVGEGDFMLVLRREVPSMPWPELVAAAIGEATRRAGDRPVALVIDTLSRVAGLVAEAEKDAGHAAAAMEPLTRAATAHGMAVVVGRHDRKGGGAVGESSRGSSAFGGEADILLQLQRPRRGEGDGEERPASNVRELAAASRFSETPGQDEPIRMRLDDAVYTVLGTMGETQAAKAERRYQAILDVVNDQPGITRTDLRSEVPTKATQTGTDVDVLLEEGRLVVGPVERTLRDGRTRSAQGLYLPGELRVPRGGNAKERQGTGSPPGQEVHVPPAGPPTEWGPAGTRTSPAGRAVPGSGNVNRRPELEVVEPDIDDDEYFAALAEQVDG